MSMLLPEDTPYDRWISILKERLGDHQSTLGSSLKLLTLKQQPNQTVIEFTEEINKLLQLSNLPPEESAKLVLDKLSNSLNDTTTQTQIITLRLKHSENTNLQNLALVKAKLKFNETKQTIVKLTTQKEAPPTVEKQNDNNVLNNQASHQVLQELEELNKSNSQMQNKISNLSYQLEQANKTPSYTPNPRPTLRPNTFPSHYNQRYPSFSASQLQWRPVSHSTFSRGIPRSNYYNAPRNNFQQQPQYSNRNFQQASGQSYIRPSQPNPIPFCTYCKKQGHIEEKCFSKAKATSAANQNLNPTNLDGTK